METISAKRMRVLREKRLKEYKCTRCGKPLSKERIEKKYKICSLCGKYSTKYNKENRIYPNNAIPKLKKWKVQNHKLYELMQNRNISTLQLAKTINVSQRQVERWLFEDSTPLIENKRKVNEFFKEQVYSI